MVELRTFGGLSIEANGAPPMGAAAQRKTLALLALLARHPRGLSRDKVIKKKDKPKAEGAAGQGDKKDGAIPGAGIPGLPSIPGANK